VAVERVDVAQDLARVLELLGAQHAGAHHEADRASCIHHVAPDAARHVLVARDRGQHLAGLVVGHVAREHLAADLVELVVDLLDRVGAVLGVGVVQAQQHVLGVRDQARHAARAQPQQAEHRHVLVVDREQHAVAVEAGVLLVQDEGHPHRARRVLVVDQEVGADMQLAVVLLEEARRFLDVLVHRVLGDREAEMLAHPAPLLGRGRLEVDPDRLEAGQFLEGFDLFLEQAAIGQGEDVEHGRAPGASVGRGEAAFARAVRELLSAASPAPSPAQAGIRSAAPALKADDWDCFP